MYVVAGATGRTGRVVADSLLQHGEPVTVIVRSADKGRDWQAKGAKVVVGVLEDAGTLQSVLAGADGAYLLIPPDHTAEEFGVLPSFLTSARRVPMLATRDAGRVASWSLLEPARGRRVIELAGPEEYSPEDIARAVGSVLQRSVRVNELPLSAAAPAFRGFGFSEDASRLFAEMIDSFNSGRIVWEGKGCEFKRGAIRPAEVFGPLLQGNWATVG